MSYNECMVRARISIRPWVMSGAIVALLPACATPSFIPASLQSQVDRSLTFSQLKDSPDSYRGRLIVLGGAVLTAKRLKDGTRIEVLQLPLDDSQRPESDRTVSEGRFVALQKGFLDPATLPEGTRVTLVGEVTGVMTLPLDETEYAYPTLEIKTLKVWPDWTAWQDGSTAYQNPLWGPYRGGAYWGRPYWWGPGWGYRGCCPSWHQGQRTTPRALHRFRPARRSR